MACKSTSFILICRSGGNDKNDQWIIGAHLIYGKIQINNRLHTCAFSDRAVRTHSSYLGGPRFKSWPRPFIFTEILWFSQYLQENYVS